MGNAGRLARLVLCALALSLVSAAGGQAAHASAERSPPFPESAAAEGLIRALYKVPAVGPILFRAPECGRAPCRVRLLAEDTWSDSVTGDHRLLVTAAEPRDDAGHVSEGVLGIGLFQKRGGRWTLKAGSSRVDAAGSYGAAPDVEIVDAGGLGRGVVAKPGFTGQGMTEAEWVLYLPIRGRYRRVLRLQAALDHSGACQPSDTACLANDFSSDVRVNPARDGITVSQVKTGPVIGPGPGRECRWHVSRSGHIRAEPTCCADPNCGLSIKDRARSCGQE